MENNEVLYEVADGIATLTLNRPDKLNAWTRQMEVEYRAALAEAENDAEVRVIIVTGAGRGFCAGADMDLLKSVMGGGNGSGDPKGEMVQPGQGDGVREDFKRHYSFPPAVGKPIIAAINGAAAGLGFVHILYCDMRFASEKAKFTTAFARRGLISEHGLSWLLPRIVGMHHAMDLTLSARVITAQEAYEIGLVGKVFPADELMGGVREYAKQLSTFSSPRSMGVIKRLLWNAQFQTLGEAIDDADQEMVESLTTDDFREGVASFLEKRTPSWPALQV